MENTLIRLAAALLCLCAVACDSNSRKADESTAASTENTVPAVAQTTVDYRTYPQYVYCKIDGQPYLAYHAEGHTTNIVNALNIPSQVVFSTSADQKQLNGETKISELAFSFYTLPKKGAGIQVSNTDFYVQGHTDFPDNGKLKYVNFKTEPGQQLTITSYKDGMLTGTFSFEVVDENDPTHRLKITEGQFKMSQGGKTSLKTDENGDANMDSLLNSIR